MIFLKIFMILAFQEGLSWSCGVCTQHRREFMFFQFLRKSHSSIAYSRVLPCFFVSRAICVGILENLTVFSRIDISVDNDD